MRGIVRALVPAVFLFLAHAAAASPPSCTVISPTGDFHTFQWSTVTVEVQCQDPDNDLVRMEWRQDIDRPYASQPVDRPEGAPATPGNGSGPSGVHSQNFLEGVQFEFIGNHSLQAQAYDASGAASNLLQWSVVVAMPPDETSGSSSFATGSTLHPDGGGDFLGSVAGLITAGAGAVVAVGGLVLGVLRIRRGQGGESGGGGGPAAPAGIALQKVGSNSGTVIGNAGQVVVQAPPPADVPAAVPPHKHALYLALARAYDILDSLPTGEEALEAREMVGDVMEKLCRGELPVRESRRPASAAIGRAVAVAAGLPGDRLAALRKAQAELDG